MLFVLTGSAAAGKTTLAHGLPALPGLAVHDFDESGVPSDADVVWRQRTLETWMRRAIELEHQGSDLLLTGQSPLGEVLSSPSTPALSGVHVCLVDCEDADRIDRLRARDGDRWGREREAAFLNWAAWMREHHADPQARPDVIRSGSWSEMRWERWSDWQSGDRRWQAHYINTSGRTVEEAVDDLQKWLRQHR